MITIDIKIKEIKIKDEKGNVISVPSAELKTGGGIIGDKNNDISIISADTQKRMKASSGFCCVDKFSSNLIIEKDGFSVGEKIRLGESIIEVVKVGRKCHGICDNSKHGSFCPLVFESVLAKVIEGGIIEVQK